MKRKPRSSSPLETISAVLLIVGAGLGAYLLLIYEGSLGWGLRWGIPLGLLALGIAGMVWTKLRRRKGERPLEARRIDDLVCGAAGRVVDGLDGRRALLEEAREMGDDLAQAVSQYLQDGAGLLRTQPGRERIDRLAELTAGDEAGVRSLLGEMVRSEEPRGGDGCLALTAILAGAIIVAVTASIAVA